MSISINTSTSAGTKVALEHSTREAARASEALATGNAIKHAYEDPTGLAIGWNMRSLHDISDVVATGIEQSSSMLYIAESAMKASLDVSKQLLIVLARANLGYMDDDSIEKTLSPTYVQLKEEMNRLADAAEFNGRKLLNGRGGHDPANPASRAVVKTATESIDQIKNTNQLNNFSLENITINTKVGSQANQTVKLDFSNAKLSFDDKSVAYDTNNAKLPVSGAKITAQGVKVSTGGKEETIEGITLSNVAFDITQDKTKVALTSAKVDAFTFNNEAVEEKAIAASFPNITVTLDSGEKSIEGGMMTKRGFDFITGTDFDKSKITVEFPNIKLTDETYTDAAGGKTGEVLGLISTLNVENYKGDLEVGKSLQDLTALKTKQDATNDFAVVTALNDTLIIALDDLGAYQKRFINVQNQLTTSVEELANAQGAILDANLATQTEVASREMVKTQFAIAMLKQLSRNLEALVGLVH